MVIDLVTKTILENHSDARRTVGASLFTSIQGIIILLNYEDTIHTTVRQCDFKKIFRNAYEMEKQIEEAMKKNDLKYVYN